MLPIAMALNYILYIKKIEHFIKVSYKKTHTWTKTSIIYEYKVQDI